MSVPPGTSGDQWTCPRCTLINNSLNPACSACGWLTQRSSPKKTNSSFPTIKLPQISAVVAKIDSAIDVIASQFASLEDRNGYNRWACPRCCCLNDVSTMLCAKCNFDQGIERSFFAFNCTYCGLQQCSLPHNSKCPVCRRKSAASNDIRHVNIAPVLYSDQNIEERNATTIYNNITGFCSAQNTSFIDDSFPHSTKSIGDFRSLDTKSPISIVWLRPQDIVTKDGLKCRWSIVSDPKPEDIEQGLVGNCWFISSLALIAERPEILDNILVTKTYDPLGVYRLRLCIDGRWETIIVDDFFPCNALKRTMIFAVGRNNQLWVSLIEKAFAKVHGNYAALRGGRIHEGLATLTGAPCQTINIEQGGDDIGHLWARLLSAHDAAFIMGASCGAGRNPVNEAEYRGLGLTAQHAYSILDLKEFNGEQLIRLKNPWGNFVWSGKWSPKWTGWTQAAKAYLEPGPRSSGTFWMPFASFVKYFDAVDIAQLHYNWSSYRFSVNIGWETRGCKCIRVTVTDPTELFISLFHRKSRGTEEDMDMILLVHEVDPSSADFTTPGRLIKMSGRRVYSNIEIDNLFVDPGVYLIYFASFMKFCEGSVKPGNLVIYSSRPVFAECFLTTGQNLHLSMEQMILKNGAVDTSFPNSVVRQMTNNFTGLITMVDNLSPTYCLQALSNCQNSMNVVSTRPAMVIADSIPPMHRQILVVLTHFEPSQPFSIHHRLTLRQTNRPQLSEFFPASPLSQHSPGYPNALVFTLHGPRSLII